MKLDNWLAQRALTSPDRTALVADGGRTSFAELEAEATWVSRRLAAQGVRRGATVALTMPAGRELVVLIHALMKLGAELLPLNPRLTAAQLTTMVTQSEARVLIVTADQLPLARQIAAGAPSIERLVVQICFRAADLAFLLDREGRSLSSYSEVLRRESEMGDDVDDV